MLSTCSSIYQNGLIYPLFPNYYPFTMTTTIMLLYFVFGLVFTVQNVVPSKVVRSASQARLLRVALYRGKICGIGLHHTNVSQ